MLKFSVNMLAYIRTLRLTKFAFPLAIIMITILATLGSGQLPPNPIRSDKLNHILAFGFLTLLALVSYPKISLFKKCAFLLGYGVFIELVQYTLPWRSCSFPDVVADILGIVLAVSVWELAKIFVLYKRK